jgi:hypothetical protein
LKTICSFLADVSAAIAEAFVVIAVFCPSASSVLADVSAEINPALATSPSVLAVVSAVNAEALVAIAVF